MIDRDFDDDFDDDDLEIMSDSGSTPKSNHGGRLAALVERADTRVEDLIKVASEMSQIQSQIEELAEQRRGLD